MEVGGEGDYIPIAKLSPQDAKMVFTCLALRPSPIFLRSQISLCRLYKRYPDETVNRGPLCVYIYICKRITHVR